MFGVMLAVSSAFCWAMLDTTRKVMGRHLSPLSSAAMITLGCSVLFFLGLFWVPVQTMPGLRFWGIVALTSLLSLSSNLLFLRAVQVSPLSLTVPYLSFTPVFMLLTGAIFLGEVPGWRGVLGACTVMVGAILINPSPDGRFRPLQALRQERGSVYMLIVAMIWSLMGAAEKTGVSEGNMFLFGGCINAVMGLSLLGYMGLFRQELLGQMRKHWKLGTLAASTQWLALLLQFWAFSYLFVAYVDTIKRSGALFAVLIGYFFFNERPLRPRLLGATVMVLGVSLIIWAK